MGSMCQHEKCEKDFRIFTRHRVKVKLNKNIEQYRRIYSKFKITILGITFVSGFEKKNIYLNSH